MVILYYRVVGIGWEQGDNRNLKEKYWIRKKKAVPTKIDFKVKSKVFIS